MLFTNQGILPVINAFTEFVKTYWLYQCLTEVAQTIWHSDMKVG